MAVLSSAVHQVMLELHTMRGVEPTTSSFTAPDEPSLSQPADDAPIPSSSDEEIDDLADHADGTRRREAWGRPRGGAAELAARRLGMLCQRMQVLLSSSHKESVRSFFYPSPEGLAYTQLFLIRLWAHLLKQVRRAP